MKLFDYGESATKSWFRQILEWSKKKVSISDNLDCIIIAARIGTSETQIGHSLGRKPFGCIEVCSYPSPKAVSTEVNGTAGIQMTKDSTEQALFLKRTSAGECYLLVF